MLPTPELESLERHSLENAEAFRELDAIHESVKGWPDGLDKALELENIQALKQSFATVVFNPVPDLPEDVREFVRRVTLALQQEMPNAERCQWFQEAYRIYAKYDVEGWAKKRRSTDLEQIKNRHGGMPPGRQSDL